MKNRIKLVISILLVTFVFGCQVTTTASASTTSHLYDYDDFSAMQLTNPESQLSQPDDEYYLYFYGLTCYSCNTIKQEILYIIDNLTNIKVYLVETHALADINENIAIDHTPALVHVVNHEVENEYEGDSNVLAIFQNMD